METVNIVVIVMLLFLMVYFSTFFYKLYSKLLKTFFIFTCLLIILWSILIFALVPSVSDGILKVTFAIFGMGFLFAGLFCGILTVIILVLYLISSGINSVKGPQNSTSVKVIVTPNTRSLPASTSQ